MNKQSLRTMTFAAIVAFVVVLCVPIAAKAQSNFVIPPDVARRYASNIRPAPTYVDARVLGAGVAEVWTAPANTRFVVFSSNCNFHARPNAAAAVPAADVSDGTASELNPAAWYFSTPVTTIGLISSTACVITISTYLGTRD